MPTHSASPPQAHHPNVFPGSLVRFPEGRDETERESMGTYERKQQFMEAREISPEYPRDIQGYSLPLAHERNYPESESRARPLLQRYRPSGAA